MSLALDGTATATIASSVRGIAWLIALDFNSGPIRYTTAPLDVFANIGSGTVTFIGGRMVDVSGISESENTKSDQITLGLTINSAALALALGNVEGYRGKPAQLWLQLFNSTFQPNGLPVKRWAGVMDKVNVSKVKSKATGGGSTGRIEILCSRNGLARVRNADGLRLSHAQQQQRFPGDKGLEYVQTLIEKPQLWLSKNFQKQ